MPTVTHVVNVIAKVTETPWSRVNTFARRLIDENLLPKSAGRHVKNATGAEVARLIFAIAHAEKIADAPKIAAAFADLPYARTSSVGGRDISRPLDIDPTCNLENMVGRILSKEIDSTAEITMIRGTDGFLRAEVAIFTANGERCVHHFHRDLGGGAGWGFRLDVEAVEKLRDGLMRGAGDG